MWIRQNADGSYTMCSSFSYWDDFKVVNITVNSDKRKNNVGFSWEGNQEVLTRYEKANTLLIEDNSDEF